MSCNESSPASPDVQVVERELELPAPPAAVWDELPRILGDDVELVAAPGGALRTHDAAGDRVGVVHEAVPAERLAFRWMPVEGDAAPSEVEITLEPSAVGTMLRVRETRLDGAHLERAAFRARAVARAGA
jgi:uncharacterized protein YndB with AHSA1/START domain